MSSATVRTIQPDGPGTLEALRELARYRGLFWFLVWRDIKVRYAQTVLGFGWALLQPVLMTLVVTILFGYFAGLPSDEAPYWIFTLTALIPWTYFSTTVTSASNSLIANPNLITKVYFPRLVIPFAPVLAGLVDLGTGLVLLVGAVLLTGAGTSPVAALTIPLLVTLLVLSAAGAGSFLAAVNIKYRDVKQGVPFLIQVWMFASPVVYPMSLVPERYRALYALNPAAGIVEGFRMSLLDTPGVGWGLVAISAAAGLLLFVMGVLYYQQVEATFADVV